MSSVYEFGVSQRGKNTIIYNNFEYWKLKENNKGPSLWRCTKYRLFKCSARLKTDGQTVIESRT